MEAPRPKRENRDEPAAAAAAALQMIELEDRRLRSGAFLMATGSCVVLYCSMLNRSANAEHLLAGFFLFTAGAALALLTLGGTGRAAARMEEVLRAFF